jgi:hypothetical protein
MVIAGDGNFDKLVPEPHKNGPAPQHWEDVSLTTNLPVFGFAMLYFYHQIRKVFYK